jgi:hypothetical protein
MYDVAPGVLQRLREADIISRAGLAIASQGQDYCRSGAVHSTKRQGARLSGIVDLSNLSFREGVTATNAAKALENYSLDRYTVSVEVYDPQTWDVQCTCPMMAGASASMCAHAAALLHQWLAHPFTFAPPVDAIPSSPVPESTIEASTFAEMSYRPSRLVSPLHSSSPLYTSGSVSALNTADTLSQLALGDLRAMAREYDSASAGPGKAELVEAIMDQLRQPEVVRRVVGTLEKAQRQFLATLILAGGHMNDEELRGLFERFSLGKPEKLQQMLVTLQGKVLLLRTSTNLSFQLRSSLNSSLLDINWYVPSEVRDALHIALPTTTYNIEGQDASSKIEYAEPFQLLPDLLLVARALDDYRVERDDRRSERSGRSNTGNLARAVNAQSGDGSTVLPAPPGLPPASLLEHLQTLVPRPPAFLRFAYLALRLSDILYIENEANSAGTSVLRMLSSATGLLLGMSRSEVLFELFTHWQRQSSYREIFDLQEEGLLLRCRATPMNQPVLRVGELEAENKAARQTLLTLLAQAPTRQWIDFTAFARLVYRLNPTFLQRRQRAFPTPHWWIEQEEGRPLQPSQWNDWQRAEGRYLAQLLQGPLHWWGISDLAFNEDGRLQAFRLTPMVELLLKGEPAEAQDLAANAAPANTAPTNDPSIDTASASVSFMGAVPAHIEVSEQDELLLQSSFENWSAIQLVERFARSCGVRAGQLCFRLTPASLSEALNRGESFAPLLELLDRAARSENIGKSGQDALLRLLRQLEKRLANYGRIRLYTDATLLEVADGLVMRELALTTSVEKQIIQNIHPTLMVLRKQGGEQLVEELKKRGQAPLLHEEG